MGQKYSANSISGYAVTPPPDDGTVSEANKIKVSTLKTKYTDPIKTLAEAIDTDLQTHFDVGPNAYTSNQTLGATHYNTINQVSGAGVTLTLTDAATLGDGWYCWIDNTDSSNTVTIARATGADTLNGTAANMTLQPGDSGLVYVIAAASGFQAVGFPLSIAQTYGTAQTFKTTSDQVVAAYTGVSSKTRLYTGSGGGTNLSVNMNTAISAQDDAAKPSWLMYLSTVSDAAAIQRSPAGSTVLSTLVSWDNTGTQTTGTVPVARISGLGSLATLSTVKQGQLTTSTNSNSTSVTQQSSGSYALAGGTWSMWTGGASVGTGTNIMAWGGGDTAAGTIGLFNMHTGASLSFYVDERYISASPPYNHGPLFVYLIFNTDGTINSLSVGPDPTWAYHGPTNIAVERYDSTGRGFRTRKMLGGMPLHAALKNPSVSMSFKRQEMEVTYEEVEVTLDYKDSDKDIAPHPWYLSACHVGQTVVLLEPGSKLMGQLYEIVTDQNAREVRDLILNDHLVIDNTFVPAPKLPASVQSVKARWKLTP